MNNRYSFFLPKSAAGSAKSKIIDHGKKTKNPTTRMISPNIASFSGED